MNNKEKKVTLEENIAEVEEATNEEVIEETTVTEENVEEVTNIEDFTEEINNTEETTDIKELTEVKEKKKKSPVVRSILVGIVDQLVSMSCAVILLFITNLILNLVGYRVKSEELITMILVMYVVVNIFYSTGCKVCKFEGTVGSKIINNR